MSMEEGRDGVEAGTNYQGPAVRKGAQDLCWHAFFFSIIIIICRLYKLTSLGQAQDTLQ